MENEIINEIKVTTTYSEVEGQYHSDFHYRFEKELNMAKGEFGEPAECYAKVSIQYITPVSPEVLEKWHKSRAPLDVSQIITSDEIKFITPITKEEYDRQTVDNEGKQG